ncbi:MAG: 7-cyano-7-deazaguanine synthase QueC [Desulfuromonadaceae bacterium]
MDNRCLIICSGGLDSTTVATHARNLDKREPILLHFQYGCRAEAMEVEAVRNIAAKLDCEYIFSDLTWLKKLGGSRLTDPDSPIAGPVEGAEFPHEWVPARNLVMISHAAAYCDANGIGEIYMGLNLEEGAVYPDNTVEFYERLNMVLPLATLVRPQIKMPLARMMKWQIVQHAYRIGAPVDLSWSCYLGGPVHCGSCGPCYMRRTAHLMVGQSDPVSYATNV